MNPVPVLLGNTDKVNSLTGLTIHRLSPDNIPPVSYGNTSECLCIDSNGSLEWAPRMRGSVYDNSGAHTMRNIRIYSQARTNGLNGRVHCWDNNGTSYEGGWLMPETDGEGGQADMYATPYVNANSSEAIKWKINQVELRRHTNETKSITTNSTQYETFSDGKRYILELADGLTNPRIWLTTNSEDTIHIVLVVKAVNYNATTGCELAFYDEGLYAHYIQLSFDQTNSFYTFDVFLKHIVESNTSYTMARIHDFPCGYRPAPGRNIIYNDSTKWIGMSP